MSSKREKCNWCGKLLLVPPNAETVRCPGCQAVTWVQSYDTLVQARDSLGHAAASRFNDLINTVSSNISKVSDSVNYSYSGPQKYHYGYGNYYRPSPPPPPPRPALTPPPAHGRKRAVLCGVSYRQKSYRLKGTVNDVKCMRYFLVDKFGFPGDSILMLTEDEINPLKIPTKHNIRLALQWLVHGSQSGDSLVFHFSGHGSQKPDLDMDEIDGYDETLCPLDFENEGMIIDDEINQTIVRPLPHGATLHAIIDACHSGTVLDLPFVCRMNREGQYTWEDQRSISGIYKGTSGGLAFSFSACDDNQITIDTNSFSGTAMTGSMTYSFIHAVQSQPGLTYGHLVNSMRSAIRDGKTTGIRLNGPLANLMNKVIFGSALSQEPQLSSSQMFDVYSKRFVL
ncbi:metacaspase-1-like isoform X1 [Tripterygium wilfordii]|uniref:Metacaspase-1-like isoform X1 n=1 Tax=Tripterygium wilfordii TaxID=458696 RepID=A0A7J7CH22_TRIWF|nr:metacaspase-1-like [Tripterygium wilfordii]KAF5733345.1 metacaspase-1-like isoform X1 [Tripterygium wilfordii]